MSQKSRERAAAIKKYEPPCLGSTHRFVVDAGANERAAQEWVSQQFPELETTQQVKKSKELANTGAKELLKDIRTACCSICKARELCLEQGLVLSDIHMVYGGVEPKDRAVLMQRIRETMETLLQRGGSPDLDKASGVRTEQEAEWFPIINGVAFPFHFQNRAYFPQWVVERGLAAFLEVYLDEPERLGGMLRSSKAIARAQQLRDSMHKNETNSKALGLSIVD